MLIPTWQTFGVSRILHWSEQHRNFNSHLKNRHHLTNSHHLKNRHVNSHLKNRHQNLKNQNLKNSLKSWKKSKSKQAIGNDFKEELGRECRSVRKSFSTSIQKLLRSQLP